MKQILLALLSLTLLLTACSKEENTPQPDKFNSTSMRFYGMKVPEQPGKQGAAQHDRLWHNGTTIKVKFLNGSDVLKERVRTVAKEWEEYANITFKFVESGDAHVRVGFDWNDNRYITWSYIGTDCKTVLDQGEATLSFAYFEYIIDTDPETVRADILRAFGQVLGLELESRNVNFSPKWTPNPALVPNYWSFNISDVMWSELKKYVFDPLDGDNAVSTEAYDKLSIMKWPFPSNILLNGGGASMNFELSDMDKVFIAMLYPKPEKKPIATIKTYHSSIGGTISCKDSITIDWGDGTIEAFGASENISLGHVDNNNSYRTIKIYGDSNAVTDLYFSRFTINELDVSGCLELKTLECSNQDNITKLDLSKNVKLTTLDCSNITSNTSLPLTLDISKCTLLESLACSGNGIETLDLSNLSKLKHLACAGNKIGSLSLASLSDLESLECSGNLLTHINVTSNQKLISLSCASNPIYSLDLSQNKKLQHLNCSYNQLTTLAISHLADLTTLNCSNNNLSSIETSSNSLLAELNCSGNPLGTIDVSSNGKLENLNCRSTQISSLNLANNTLLKELYCSSNSLGSLDLSGNNQLQYLFCGSCSLNQLDLSNLTKLSWLVCSNNNLTNLDASENNDLFRITCHNNPIILNQTALRSFVQSLPVTRIVVGNIYIDNATSAEWIKDIIKEKDWYIGLYDNE